MDEGVPKPTYEDLERLIAAQDEQIDLLRRQNEIDPSTGLMTKAAWKEALQTKTESAKPDDEFGVIFIDFRRFSWVNNTLGHETGDKVLARAANSIRLTAGQLFQRESDLLTIEPVFEPSPAGVGRLGGDEIAIICDLSSRGDDTTKRSPEQRMQAQIRRFRLAFHDDVLRKIPELHDIGFNISIGGAVWKADMDATDLLIKADEAMYRDKEEQRNRQPLLRRAAEKMGNRLLRFAVGG